MIAPLPRNDVEQRERRWQPRTWLASFLANNWKVVLYVVLILLCVLFAPEEPLKFIYTEF